MSPAEANELVAWLIGDALDQAETQISLFGEVVDLKDHRARGGAVYFALQEGKHRFRCQLPAELADGLGDYLQNGTVLECEGQLVLAKFGSSHRVELAVESATVLEGEASPRMQLLNELEARGWLEEKRELPERPTRIGLVTSPESEAVADFLSVLGELEVEVDVVGVSLASEASVAEGLRQADRQRYDVIVLTRGGGEGLGLFDSPEVAEAIHRVQTPLVSAIGHERDWTIADYLADARAATPTAAARLVVAGHFQAASREVLLEQEVRRTNLWRNAALLLALLLLFFLAIYYLTR